jgi:penicillin-binding protein 2
MKKLAIKDHQNEIKLFQGRAIALCAFVLLFALIIAGRLFYLQIIGHGFYTTLSEQNIVNIIPITPKRGLIYDRNGILLAKNVPVFSLMIVPGRVKHLNETVKELEKILTITPEQLTIFQRNLHQYHRFSPIPLIAKLTEVEAAKFYVNQYRFPGVSVTPHLLREYILGETFSNVIGYVARITREDMENLDHDNYVASGNIGKTGIEKQYEALLRGTPGSEEVEINARGEVVRTLKKTLPTPGENLYLTIDSRLQQFTEKALGDDAGVVIAINPNNGEILAMVSNPSFDPNPFVTGISTKEYQALLNAPNHPLYNRAIRGLYSPGSTIKPFYAIAALDSGQINKDTSIVDHGQFQVPNTKHVFHDWKLNGHGIVNVTKALAVSCDTFFYNLAQNMGIYKMDQILLRFGFGVATGIDFPGELSGVVPSPEWKRKVKGLPWYSGDAINAGIGQGTLLVTPLQLVVATAALATHGMRLKPYLVLKQDDPSGLAPIILNNENVWETVTEGMQDVLRKPYGTANGVGKNLSYAVAAKTGTAQVFGNRTRSEEKSELNIPKLLRNNHLFIAYAPVDHPQIALVVIVEHNAKANQVAREVLDFYFHAQAALPENKPKESPSKPVL